MIRKLIIQYKDLNRLKEIAKSALPLEACALLIGSIKDKDGIIEGIKMMQNTANSSIMFILDPDEFYNAYKEIRDDGKELVSIFHAHPGKAEPSQTDIKYMIINQIPWLIMSNTDYSINAYAYYDRLEKLELVLLDSS
ncbi:MAG: M67 family peptidase [Candidatus Nitrosothermus koennekii]|nr:MAG: M67 family peptidase [Candidatus Nitrosothermus koennekii]